MLIISVSLRYADFIIIIMGIYTFFLSAPFVKAIDIITSGATDFLIGNFSYVWQLVLQN